GPDTGAAPMSLNLQPDGASISLHPEDSFRFRTAYPASIAGREFTATWGSTTIEPTIDGDDVLVHLTSTHTAKLGTRDLVLRAVGSVNGRTGIVAGLAEQTDLTAEAAARAAADTALSSAVAAEASTRATADTTLQTNITAEANARVTADALVTSTEIARANAAYSAKA